MDKNDIFLHKKAEKVLASLVGLVIEIQGESIVILLVWNYNAIIYQKCKKRIQILKKIKHLERVLEG